MGKSSKKGGRSKTSIMLESYRKKARELKATEGILREKASEKIIRLNSNMPKWTLGSIAARLKISSSAVSKIKTKDPDIGMETIGRALEIDFDKHR